MVGYDHRYPYPIQVETIDGRCSYTSGHRDRQSALAYARQLVATQHAGTTLHGRDCTVLLHTPYATRIIHRANGHTDRDIAAAR